MKKASEDLFLLIKSLNRNEKGYFKRLSSFYTKKGDANYLALFDAIQEQDHYNEDELKKKFQGERFVRQIHVAKNYLYNFILESTELYQKDIDSRLRSYLNQIEFLSEKSLYPQCEKLVRRAKKMALHYERFTLLLDVLALENRLMRKQLYTVKSEKEMEEMYIREMDSIDKYRNIVEYRHFVSSIFMKIYSGKKQAAAQKLKSVAHSPLFTSMKKLNSGRAKILYYYGKSSFSHSVDDHQNAYTNMRKLVAFYESNPKFIEINPGDYHNALKNLVAACNNLSRFDETFINVQKLKSLSTKSKHLNEANFYFINIILLTLYINTGALKEGLKLIGSIQKEFKEQDLKQTRNKSEIELFYCFAYLYIYAEQYDKAKYFLRKIINNSDKHRTDLYCSAKIVNLIVHFEMKSDDLMISASRSTSRYLQKINRHYKFEILLLKFIEANGFSIHSEKERMAAYKYLRAELVKIFRDPTEKKELDYFDFESWLVSKIEKRKFVEVVKEKKLAIHH